MDKPKRFGIHVLNNKFVVQDSARVGEPIMTWDGRHADNALAEDMRFFGMNLADAEALAEQLNANPPA